MTSRLAVTPIVALGLALIAPMACTADGSQPVVQQQNSAVAEPARADGRDYGSHTEAAVGAALQLAPGLVRPSVTEAIVIFTDHASIDLRVQVKDDRGYCQWFGVNDALTDAGLRWRSGRASACDTWTRSHHSDIGSRQAGGC